MFSNIWNSEGRPFRGPALCFLGSAFANLEGWRGSFKRPKCSGKTLAQECVYTASPQSTLLPCQWLVQAVIIGGQMRTAPSAALSLHYPGKGDQVSWAGALSCQHSPFFKDEYLYHRYTCTHTHAHICKPTCTHAYTRTYTYTHVHTNGQIHTYTYIPMYTEIHMYICKDIRVYAHTYT